MHIFLHLYSNPQFSSIHLVDVQYLFDPENLDQKEQYEALI